MKDMRAESGTIDDVYEGIEDHGIYTISIIVDFNGSVQGFGNLCLDKDSTGPDFKKKLCSTFGVRTIGDLRGKPCIALRCFDRFNEPIEGLRAEDGSTFTITSWRKRHDKKVKNRLQSELETADNEIGRLTERIKQLKEWKKKAPKAFKDWG